ncbi:8-oxo-dGTP diphosphatase [Lachnospiraceae bacterium XPB1003]|nr:8-oxo-dGTP diphosphatase [Lachnospiraceae bacterium XPB1003]
MKTVNVVAAVICDDLNRKSKVFATQRGYGEYKDGWEFPGGKIEENESPEEALIREIREELGVTIAVHDLIDIIDHDYPDFHLHMFCYWATVSDGQLMLLEHEDARWLDADSLETVGWLPADRGLLTRISTELEKKG